MELRVKKLALRSAAKVAFGSIAAGCGGSMMVASDAGVDAKVDAFVEKDAAIVDVARTPDAPEDAALACTGPTEVDASDVDESVFQCCVVTLQSQVGDASPFDQNGPDASLVANDPAATNCCRVVIARIDHEPDGGSFGDDYASATSGVDLVPWCCDVAFEMGPACTPWGPPTPPAMPAATEVA